MLKVFTELVLSQTLGALQETSRSQNLPSAIRSDTVNSIFIVLYAARVTVRMSCYNAFKRSKDG